MATIITDECINCGACEPECPNNAIYQGGVEYEGLDGAKHPPLSNEFFYIVPEKCTECVGFYDHEACAAVCPVDCCVPDPNNVESEEALIERAKRLHPDRDFGEDFPSRFRAGAQGGEAAPTASPSPAADAPAPAAPAPAVPTGGAPTTFATVYPEDALLASVPLLDDWEVPLTCFRCGGPFEVPFQFIKPGTVLHCPHCYGSFVPNTTMYQNIARKVTSFYDQWTAELAEMKRRHQAQLERFEDELHSGFARLKEEVREIGSSSELAGAPQRNRGFFG